MSSYRNCEMLKEFLTKVWNRRASIVNKQINEGVRTNCATGLLLSDQLLHAMFTGLTNATVHTPVHVVAASRRTDIFSVWHNFYRAGPTGFLITVDLHFMLFLRYTYSSHEMCTWHLAYFFSLFTITIIKFYVSLVSRVFT